jgi:putative protease
MELLAPAGGMEQLDYALHFGADAVYLGGEQFGLRVRADNFSDAELAEAVRRVHDRGKRVHVTLNALMHESDLDPLRDFVRYLAEIGIDAVIASDLATIDMVQQLAPQIAIHLSTQASCTNHLAARRYYDLGVRRIVLARELSLAEIAHIRKCVPDDLELEVFVHGAMCMAYSGRCLISAYLTGRDANRGHCTQPCRWHYALEEEKRPGEFFPVEEDGRGTYIMNSKDLMMLDHLDDLAEAGVDSIKIEGRVKGAYYIATVVNAYRKVLDGADPCDYLPELDAVSHRPYHTGFFYGPAEQACDESTYVQTHDWVAVVDTCEPVEAPGVTPEAETAGEVDSSGQTAGASRDGARGEGGRWLVHATQRNRFFAGDELSVLSPTSTARFVHVSDLRDETGTPCEVANRTLVVYSFVSEAPLSPHDILRRKRDDIRVKG